MFDWLFSIVNFLLNIANWLLHNIRSFLNILLQLPKFLNFVILAFNSLPTYLVGYATVFISVVVIYFIIGRRKA